MAGSGWGLAIVVLIGLGSTGAEAAGLVPADLAAAVARGDTEAVTRGIVEAYGAAGAAGDDTLAWRLQPYDRVVNWYDTITNVITLSALPGDDEVAPYWANWKRTLTGGRWDWRAFFPDPAEARAMARFNQFVLAAHEYGHALAYRYDPDHVERANGEINCRELAADRLTAGLLEELAAADERFAHWRQRYGELAAAINAAIDPAVRYAPVPYSALDADCAVMHVVQPDAQTMTPYASAYFVRWQALLATDLPPLADLYKAYLFKD